jgi:hypothetical protein
VVPDERAGTHRGHVKLFLTALAFTAVTRVQIPSGTPNLFSNLRATARSVAGTKRHNFGPEFTVQFSGNTDLSRMSNLFLKSQKGTSGASAVQAQPPREPEARNSRITSLGALRLWIVTAWVYVSNVTRLEACRSSSCITLMSAPVALNSDE